MDLSNNELFQMLLTDMINMNNQIINNNDTGNMLNNNNNYIYNNYNHNTILNNIINNIQYEIMNENENFDDVPPLFPVFPFYNNSAPNSQAVLHQSLYDRNPIKHVVTDEVKNGLITIKFVDAKDRDIHDKCSITMEKFNDDDEIIQLPCNHCFCVEPIMQWLTEESCECPVCRYKFDSMEKNTRHIESDETVEIIGIENLPDLIEIDNQLDTDIIQLGEADRILLNGHNMAFSRIIHSLFTDEDFINNADIGPPSADVD